MDVPGSASYYCTFEEDLNVQIFDKNRDGIHSYIYYTHLYIFS